MRRHSFRAGMGASLLLLVSAAAAAPPEGTARTPGTAAPVRVYAAAGVAGALREIGSAFTKKTGTPVEVVSGGSVTLSREILQGAPADIFVPEGGQVLLPLLRVAMVDDGSTFPFATNSLVVAAPADRARPLSSPEEMTAREFRVLSLPDPDLNPTGILARRCLVVLGLWDRLQAKVRTFRHVGPAAEAVESGEADLGIFYATDVKERPRLRTVLALPPSSYDPIPYAAALVARPGAPAAARPFLAFLRGPEAREAIHAAGLTPPGGPRRPLPPPNGV